MAAQEILSALAANRKTYFELVASLERVTSCNIDEMQLTAIIDAEFPARDKLTRVESRALLLQVSRRARLRGD